MISKSNKSKKGFTIVELVIVIAVVAILSAVLIPTFVGLVKKAKVSADVMTVRNINNSLKMSESSTGKKPATYTEMLEIAGEAGYDVNKLNPTTEGYAIVWDKDSNTLYLYNEEGKLASNQQGTPSSNLWYMVKTASEAEAASAAGQNVYLSNEYDTSTITVKGGIEVAGKTNVHLSTNEAGTYDVCLNGGKLEVTADKADVNSFGTKSEVVINAVKIGTFKENGNVNGNVLLKKGGLEVKSYAKVYSVLITAENLSNVKVAIPSASSLETVVTATSETVAAALKNNTNINVPQTKVEDTAAPAESSEFAGGFGTEKAPFLIATAEQFMKISDGKFYNLLNDIDLTGMATTEGAELGGTVYHSAWENVSFNGNNHTITVTEEVKLAGYVKNSTVENVNVNTVKALFHLVEGVTLDTVTVDGKMEVERNSGAFVIYARGTVVLKNCVNKATLVGSEGGERGYNAVFVGYTYRVCHIAFENCVNEGSLVCGKASMLVGNFNTQGNEASLTVTNCENKGVIRSTYEGYTPNQYYSASNPTNMTLTVNGEVTTVDTNFTTGTSQGPNDTIVVSVNADGTYSFTKSNNSTVAKYVVNLTFYSSYDGGSLVQTMSEEIDATDAASYTTILKNYRVTMGGTDFVSAGLLNGYKLVEKNGETFYLFESDTYKIGNRTKVTVSVSAYDANGNLVSSASL